MSPVSRSLSASRSACLGRAVAGGLWEAAAAAAEEEEEEAEAEDDDEKAEAEAEEETAEVQEQEPEERARWWQWWQRLSGWMTGIAASAARLSSAPRGAARPVGEAARAVSRQRTRRRPAGGRGTAQTSGGGQ